MTTALLPTPRKPLSPPAAQATCPNCGMPLANNGKCPFCDRKHHSFDISPILSTTDQIAQLSTLLVWTNRTTCEHGYTHSHMWSNPAQNGRSVFCPGP